MRADRLSRKPLPALLTIMLIVLMALAGCAGGEESSPAPEMPAPPGTPDGTSQPDPEELAAIFDSLQIARSSEREGGVNRTQRAVWATYRDTDVPERVLEFYRRTLTATRWKLEPSAERYAAAVDALGIAWGNYEWHTSYRKKAAVILVLASPDGREGTRHALIVLPAE